MDSYNDASPDTRSRASLLASATTFVQPEFATIKVWCALSGMSTSGAYKALAAGELRAIKLPGTKRTLIDVKHGLAWLRSAPLLQLGVKQEAEAPQKKVRSSPF